MYDLFSEARADLPLPPRQSFAKSLEAIEPKRNSYFVLTRNEEEFIQCGGGKARCTVEVRLRSPTQAGVSTRFIIGHRAGGEAEAHVPMSQGGVHVLAREVLTIDEAALLFTAFFNATPFSAEYALRAQETWQDPAGLYFDDPETGPARATSHPDFVHHATDDFFYDGADDFSPFGNDDGHDTLHALENWYREGGSDFTPGFLYDLLASWNFGVPENIADQDPAQIEAWLRQHAMHENYLAATCRAQIATAFGQWKISGRIHPESQRAAQNALRLSLWQNQRARQKHPQWPHAEAEAQRLARMQAVLEQYGRDDQNDRRLKNTFSG